MKTRSQSKKECMASVPINVRGAHSEPLQQPTEMNISRPGTSCSGTTGATASRRASSVKLSVEHHRHQSALSHMPETVPTVQHSVTDNIENEQSGNSQHSRPTSTKSSRSAATLVARQLAAEAQLARRQLERERQIAQQETERQRELAQREKAVEQHELQAQLAAIKAERINSMSCGSRASYASEVDDRTVKWVHDNTPNIKVNDVTCVDRDMSAARQSFCGVVQPSDRQMIATRDATHPSTNNVTTNIPLQYTSNVHQSNGDQLTKSLLNNDVECNNVIPTSDISQLAAAIATLAASHNKPRKPKYVELFAYSGNPSEWLAFQRSFNDTKSSFSAVENLARLRRVLRGAAREAVAMLLVSADDPEEVMHILEQTCARPELIVINEMASVRNLPKLNNDFKELNTFACRIRNCVATIQMLKQEQYLHSPELFNILMSKLTPYLRMRWTDYAVMCNPSKSKITMMSEFLISEADKHIKFGMIGSDHVGNFQQSTNVTKSLQHFNRRETTHATSVARPDHCVYCKQKHNIINCTEFKMLSIDDRWRWVRESKVCFRCLKGNSHTWNTCKVKQCMQNGCIRRHHSMLHGGSSQSSSLNKEHSQHIQTENSLPSVDEQGKSDMSINSQNNVNICESNQIDSSFACNAPQRVHTQVLLKVVPVIVTGPKGSIDTYALLDDGSTSTLIDADTSSRIGATGPRGHIRVEGVGGMVKNTNVNYIEFSIRGRNMTQSYVIHDARSIPSLSLCSQTIRSEDVTHYPHITDLLSELTYEDATPTVLIGARDWYLSVTRILREGTRSQPVAAKTLLGWVLYGTTYSKSKPVEFVSHTTLENDQPYNDHHLLENLIKDQYKLDSIGIIKQEFICNTENKRALQILDETSRQLSSGRFEVGLLWRSDITHVPDSYQLALSRLKSLERRMAKDNVFAGKYKENMKAMVDKGYAEECPSSTYHDNQVNNSIRWYLPHFAVFHPQKLKMRVVHDAAAKVGGHSLNSLLLTGPDLLQSLLGILFRFREGKIALNADIQEMFPQIKIRKQDRDAQRYLWRDGDTSKPVKEYRMTSVIFGAASSPCTALYIKNKNAHKVEAQYPEAAHAIIHDHYMDDFIGSVDNVNEAARLAADIVTVHGFACLKMRGWVSNDVNALSLVPLELRAVQPNEVGLGSLPSSMPNIVNTLGFKWNPTNDTLGFRTGLTGDLPQSITKRIVLSHVMRVYDPLGLLAPIIIKGRILFQNIWRTGIDWDTKLSTADTQLWMDWFRELKEISVLSIPRCYLNKTDPIERQLHTFADASEFAYVSVSYWRFTYPDGNVKLALIASKSRVAPLKPVSIPRLELQAALIAARLANTINHEHRHKPTKTYFWTDSMTVLSWLRSDARTFKPFVAHRVGEISEITNISDWNWVPSRFNVADDATRMNSGILNLSHRWLTGPSFLLSHFNEWPKETSDLQLTPCLEEIKTRPKDMVLIQTDKQHELPSPVAADPSRFSEWNRLVRATGRAHRCAKIFMSILDNLKSTASNNKVVRRFTGNPITTELITSHLTASDLLIAEQHILRQSQQESFKTDLDCIQASKPLPKHSQLMKLSPIMGDDHLLRLAGRIGFADDVTQNVKNPIILDGRHTAVHLLIKSYHDKAAHANNEQVLNELRQHYWILKVRNAVKKASRNCQFCRIRKSQPLTPLTGDLLPERLAHHHRPFTFVGLDYFGPVEITVCRHREKRYVALFTCMTSRAIHLEVVGSLSADAAIMALRRFIARRGTPTKIFSDNGTSFVGASRQLIKLYDEAVTEFAANKRIHWSFIPPSAPFMGGCWERLVRSVKTALKTTLFERAPKEEILHTMLLEAESVVNSRPLTHVSIDPNDPEAITPFHFIYGSSSGEPLPITLTDHDLLRRSDWKKAMRLTDHFWSRWLKEYLPCLLPRSQCKSSSRNLQIDDIVLIVDPNLPRGTWPKGRVTAVYPGHDKTVRVVDVKTQGGTLRRPAKRIVRLPIEMNE